MVDVERRIREIKIRYPHLHIVKESPHYNRQLVRRSDSRVSQEVLSKDSIDPSQQGDEQL